MVAETNGNYSVSEASIECQSPYIGNDEYYNVYPSQLNYYFVSNIFNKASSVIDVTTY